LKAFKKVDVDEKIKEVDLTLNPIDFSYWNTTQKLFVVEPGRYGIHVGSSSRDIRLSSYIDI
jgi:beta-glucosidase